MIILTLETFTYSNGLIGASISNGVSHSIGFFDITNNSVFGATSSVMTQSGVDATPLLKDRLNNDARKGYEFYVEFYKLPLSDLYRVTYYKWDSRYDSFELIKNILIQKDYSYTYNDLSQGNVKTSCGKNYPNCGY